MYIERESGNDESDFQEQDGVLPIDQDFSDLRGLSPMVLDGFGVRSVVALGLPNFHPSHPTALRIPGDRATPQRGAPKALRRSAAEIPRRARIRWIWVSVVSWFLVIKP